MSQEISTDLQPDQQLARQGKALELGVTVSPISQRMQEAAQIILASSDLLEVEESIFSTCREPIEDAKKRLIRARDLMIPLVEVATFPEIDTFDTLRLLFGVEGGKLARGIQNADGLERNDNIMDKNTLEYETVELSIPGMHQRTLNGSYGSEVTSVIISGEFSGYDDSENERRRKAGGSFGEWHAHEAGHLSNLDRKAEMILKRALRNFSIATRLEAARVGVVEATADEEIPGVKQLTASNN